MNEQRRDGEGRGTSEERRSGQVLGGGGVVCEGTALVGGVGMVGGHETARRGGNIIRQNSTRIRFLLFRIKIADIFNYAIYQFGLTLITKQSNHVV